MVYRKRRSYKRAPKKTNYFSTASQALATAGTALALAKSVKKLVNTEYKSINIQDGTSWAVGTAISNQSLLSCAQGTTDTTRTGNSIRVKKLQARMLCTWNSATANTAQRIRIVMFRYMGNNGASPAFSTELFDGSTNMLTAFRNTDYGKQFKVYYDQMVVLSSQKPSVFLNFNKKVDFHTEYIGTTANASDVGTNNCYWIAVSDDNTTPPTIRTSFRSRFIDN